MLKHHWKRPLAFVRLWKTLHISRTRLFSFQCSEADSRSDCTFYDPLTLQEYTTHTRRDPSDAGTTPLVLHAQEGNPEEGPPTQNAHMMGDPRGGPTSRTHTTEDPCNTGATLLVQHTPEGNPEEGQPTLKLLKKVT